MIRLKYLLVYLLPASVYFSFTSNGILTFIPLFLFFGFVPILELFIAPDRSNFTTKKANAEKANRFYSLILYFTLPVQIIFLFFFFKVIQEPGLSNLTFAGRIFSMGLMCGVMGINVGHELGHRSNRLEQFIGELLLLTSLNTHFLPYHNEGHHRNVATPNDSATAKKNEWIFLFWIRSHFGSYAEAWQIESNRLLKKKISKFSFHNKMILYSMANGLLLFGIYFYLGFFALTAFILAAIIGILLLETVNYIEHYGLLRLQDKNGKYERVKHQHSWNSDSVLSKLFLFNLSRHSDHHFKGSKKYQILESLPQSPQMPTGYPGMMLLALIPPLWFSYMNKRLRQFQTTLA
ncbi:MAG: alkane 1-monooxygenase [Flavobacteriales bacterium CG_4_9_14_0_2_um_filter_35_242]|nr:MAG: alkane 1-monooxygenase [Flavobacteriaceae bacterium CG1_02_35_72]PJA04951.1 MAG: alkane 1-monooxygenase [Flavobacteriales bacterium CG_4_10_14_0_2_um_filter_35_18]PJC58773.1 MAG: alkane 1-monooxygenase [Flavobacteriales bacterium CG_4_9_14_0_2_um_filter_35_242]